MQHKIQISLKKMVPSTFQDFSSRLELIHLFQNRDYAQTASINVMERNINKVEA